MPAIHARYALTPAGWEPDVRIEWSEAGRITAITPDPSHPGPWHDLVLPAPGNLHSHTFQRAMAGLTERRGPDGRDSFWTWRRLMYRFLDRLSPDQIEAVAALAFVEMLEAGFGAVAEFHYLHHAPGGAGYADPAELSARILAAARDTGIGLTLLPVLYQHGGCDRRPLAEGQLRFGCDPDRFARLYEAARGHAFSAAADTRLGVAPHSLRAVDPAGLAAAQALCPEGPIHVHAAEQTAEVEEVLAHLGARPVAYLADTQKLDPRWCLIHATQMEPGETAALARSGAVAGLCPVTEANLGDGIFDGVSYLGQDGVLGIGTDSNVGISLFGELRALEYSQRLRDRSRAALASAERSSGRTLFDAALRGGTRALGRGKGGVTQGAWADLLAIPTANEFLAGRKGDALLDSLIFAAPDHGLVSDVWSAGRHVVEGGRHRNRDRIRDRYLAVLADLEDAI